MPLAIPPWATRRPKRDRGAYVHGRRAGGGHPCPGRSLRGKELVGQLDSHLQGLAPGRRRGLGLEARKRDGRLDLGGGRADRTPAAVALVLVLPRYIPPRDRVVALVASIADLRGQLDVAPAVARLQVEDAEAVAIEAVGGIEEHLAHGRCLGLNMPTVRRIEAQRDMPRQVGSEGIATAIVDIGAVAEPGEPGPVERDPGIDAPALRGQPVELELCAR